MNASVISLLAPVQLPALGRAGPYAPRRRQRLIDVCGRPAAELAVVPDLYLAVAWSVTALTDGSEVIGRLVAEPPVPNVHVGNWPTCTEVPGTPHDGYLARFQMRAKTVQT